MSRFQKYHLKWPWTATQVNNLDDMLGDLFKALAALTSTSISTSTASTTTAVGPQGIPGQDGIDGTDGTPGIQGPIGPIGLTGFGLPGSDGEDGQDSFIPGPPGTAGSAGAAGSPGATGATGPIGLGFPGQDGEDGQDSVIPGPAGLTGPTGLTGATGAAGVQGPIGFGLPGMDGEDGQDSYIPGPVGPAGSGGAGTVDMRVCEGRLTLTSGTPVTTGDVTAATNIYWTPYVGKYVALYDGVSAWTLLAFAETTLALGTLTAAKPYDVFAYNNSGTLGLELLAWTSDSARATALTLQDGVLVKTGATTRRYLGTFYTTATTTTEDSTTKRYLWNYYNRKDRLLYRVDPAGSWTYTISTIRQANANALNQVEVVVGWAEAAMHLTAAVEPSVSITQNVAIGIGEDSTTVIAAGGTSGSATVASGTILPLIFQYSRLPAVGRHVYAWLEWSAASGTTTWFTGTSVLAGIQSGLNGWIEG